MSAEHRAARIKIKDRDRAAEVINRVITPQTVLDVLLELQGPAPSGTEIYTRTPQIKTLLKELDVPTGTFRRNFGESGSPAILLQIPKTLWVSAHSDTISYAVTRRTSDSTVDLTPLAAHRPEQGVPEFSAAVMHFNESGNKYVIISQGRIGSRWEDDPDDKEEDPEKRKKICKPYYVSDTPVPNSGFSPELDRVVFTPTVTKDDYNLETGFFRGNVDNAAGIAVSILSLKALAELARQNGNKFKFEDFSVGFVFPGQEEGLPEQSAFFSRGARQMIHTVSRSFLPRAIIEVDGQDIKDGYAIPNEALLGGIVSGGKGVIVAPHSYSEALTFLRELAGRGVSVMPSSETNAVVSRSNDVAFMERRKLILPLGYGERNPHFNYGAPETNLHGLVNNARAVAWIAASMKA